MEFLSDRLFVALAKRAGFPALAELKRCRDLQIDWIRGGTPATLFVVSQIEGVIGPEETTQFQRWAQEVMETHPDRRALSEQGHAPTEEVEVTHAFQRDDPKEASGEDAFGPWIPDQDLLDSAEEIEEEDDDSLELLPDDDSDMAALGRIAHQDPNDGSDLKLIDENEAGEVFWVLATREFDAYEPEADSQEAVFPTSDRTELWDDDASLDLDLDEEPLGLDVDEDPLDDILSVLDEQAEPKTDPAIASAFGGLIDVCEDSDVPPPTSFMFSPDPDATLDPPTDPEDGLRRRVRKRSRELVGSSGTRSALRQRAPIRRTRSKLSRWRR
jgi:hypothetical protein